MTLTQHWHSTTTRGTTLACTPIPPLTARRDENSPKERESQEDIVYDGSGKRKDHFEEAPEVQRLPEKGNSRPIGMENSSAAYRALPKRGIKRTGRLANLPPKQGEVASSPKPRPRTSNEIRDLALSAVAEGAEYTVHYLLSVLKIVGNLSRWPIAFGTTSFLLVIIMGFVSTNTRRAFEPLCVIPGISLFSACDPDSGLSARSVANTTPKWADYSKLMDVDTTSFKQLLEPGVGASALALEIKKAEMATTDLIIRVQISDLKARDALAAELTEFVEEATQVGTSLQHLASQIGGSVDSIVAVNDYALRSISNARTIEPAPWPMAVRRIWTDPSNEVDKVVMRIFEEAMHVLSVNVARLIVKAKHSLLSLVKLEQRLEKLQEIVAREDSSILSAKADLLEALWTKVGGNRKHLKAYEYRLLVLKGLVIYRRQALAHIVAALQTLQAMEEDMQDIRKRVATPLLMGSTIPVEIHIESIQAGLEKLTAERSRASRLEADAVRKILMEDVFA